MMSTSDAMSEMPATPAASPTTSWTPERTRAMHWARQAMDLLDVGVIWLDQRGRPLLLNAVAEQVLGTRIVHDRDGATFAPDLAITLDGATLDRVAVDRVDRGTRNGRGDAAGRPEHVPVTVTDHRGRTVRGRMAMGRVAGSPVGEHVMAITLAVEAPLAATADVAALADHGLTAREIEVVDLLLLGHRVATIASMLFVSPHTVRNRLKSIFPKLGVHSQVELVRVARGMQHRIG